MKFRVVLRRICTAAEEIWGLGLWEKRLLSANRVKKGFVTLLSKIEVKMLT